MLEKWERQPVRVGMLLGFVAMPLGWWLRDASLRLALGFGSDTTLYFQLLHFFAAGALPGAILGAGLSKAAFAWRRGDEEAAKRHLVVYSALVGLLSLLLVAPGAGAMLQNAALKVQFLGREVSPRTAFVIATIVVSFPLHCAVLTLFISLLMRARR